MNSSDGRSNPSSGSKPPPIEGAELPFPKLESFLPLVRPTRGNSFHLMRSVPPERLAPQPPAKFLFFFALVLRYLSVALHELGHWAVLSGLGCHPVMGFTGLLQTWEGAPPHAQGWISIVFEGATGYLHLSRAPSPIGWAFALGAGLATTLLLAWVGLLLANSSRSLSLRIIGWVLALVNSLGILFFPLNYWYSKGDTAFMAHYLEVSELWVAAVYEALRATVLVWALALLGNWRQLFRWALPVLGGYLLGMPLLYGLQRIDRTVFVERAFGASHLGGFPFPVLLLNLLALFFTWRMWKELERWKERTLRDER